MKRRGFLKLCGISAVASAFGIGAVAKEPEASMQDFNGMIDGIRTIEEQNALYRKAISGHMHVHSEHLNGKIVMCSTPSGKESELYRAYKKMADNSIYGKNVMHNGVGDYTINLSKPYPLKNDFGIVQI